MLTSPTGHQGVIVLSFLHCLLRVQCSAAAERAQLQYDDCPWLQQDYCPVHGIKRGGYTRIQEFATGIHLCVKSASADHHTHTKARTDFSLLLHYSKTKKSPPIKGVTADHKRRLLILDV